LKREVGSKKWSQDALQDLILLIDVPANAIMRPD
jgi:hypothetical protein